MKPCAICRLISWISVACGVFFAAGPAVAARQTVPDEPAFVGADINNLVLQQWRNEDNTRTDDLCVGDKLLKWDGELLTDNDDLVSRWLKKRAGETTQVLVERTVTTDGKPETRQLEIPLVHEAASQIYADCMSGGRTVFRTAEDIHPEWEAIESPIKQVALEMLAERGPEILSALDAAFSRHMNMLRDHFRSDHIAYLLARPFHAETWARHYLDPLATATTPAPLVSAAWQLAEPQSRPLPAVDVIAPIAADATFEQCLAHLDDRVAEVDLAFTDLFSEFSAEEITQLEVWAGSFQPLWRGEDGWEAFVGGIQLAKRMAPDKLGRAVALSGQLLNDIAPGGPVFERIKATAADAKPGKTGTRITVHGPDADQATVRTAIVIDLGGDDAFVFAPLPQKAFTRLFIDLGGNDTLIDRGGGLAAGILGSSLIVNAGGNDVYLGLSRSIGFALVGMGAVWDSEGDDTYRGAMFTQGVGCLGSGILADLAGNDRYEASSYGQAVGLTAGCGLLFDRDGDDVYVCTGKDPSPYGDAGEYAGWGQGCGFGFRSAGAGGVGALVDLAGRDFYRAGQFGLGCGYYFGVGLVNDRSGDDVYEFSRYGMASGAHYAAGLVLDDAGRDTYLGLRSASVATMGSTWDLCLGMLIDGAGDDVYQGETYTLGGAAQTCYGFFWDRQGRDVYRTSGGSAVEGAGYIGGATYGGGRLARNLAVFIDEGGAEDEYRLPERANNTKGVNSEFGVWVDR